MLSGAKMGDIGKALMAGKPELARDRAAYWMDLYPDACYLELQRTGRDGDEDCLHLSVELAQSWGCRWWPPTTCTFWRPKISRPTKPGSVSARAAPWTTRAGIVASVINSTCAAPRT